jgi:hypothetical protein
MEDFLLIGSIWLIPLSYCVIRMLFYIIGHNVYRVAALESALMPKNGKRAKSA